MNGFAKEIGLNDTSFRDASGLSSLNISNADNLFILAKYIYQNDKELLSKTRLSEMTLATTTDHNFHHFISINPFTPYAPFIGGKTGRTKEAKESMVSLFNYQLNNNSTSTLPIAVIILRSEFGEREMDTERILEKLDKSFK
jgi:D-alanyl-D-alanine carboxypeptidase